MSGENFVDPSKLSVIIPYSDLEKFMNLARDMEVMKAQYSRMQEQYSAIYGINSGGTDAASSDTSGRGAYA